jgi:hypothetical protein
VQTNEQGLPPDNDKGRLRNSGLILEHPKLRAAEDSDRSDVPLVYLDESVWSELKQKGATEDYSDPFKSHTASTEPNRYLAAAESVRLKRRGAGGDDVGPSWEDTGLLVVVQDDYATEVAPAVQLERKLVRWTLLALGVAAALVTGLWVVVSRGLINAPRSRLAAFLRRRSGVSIRTSVDTASGARSSVASAAPATPHVTRPVLPGAAQVQSIDERPTRNTV